MTSGLKSAKKTIKSSNNLSVANATALTEKMALVFSKIEDPRVERTRVHLLTDTKIAQPKRTYLKNKPHVSTESDSSPENTEN